MFHYGLMVILLNIVFSTQGMSYYWIDGVESFKVNTHGDSKLIHLIDQAHSHYRSRPELNKEIAQEIDEDQKAGVINWQNNKGFTALHLAAAFHNVDTVKLLLAKPDIKVNLKNTAGKTPLFLAIPLPKTDKHDVTTIVQLLMDHGADPLIEDQYGNNAYDQAKNNPHLIKLMKEERAVYLKKQAIKAKKEEQKQQVAAGAGAGAASTTKPQGT